MNFVGSGSFVGVFDNNSVDLALIPGDDYVSVQRWPEMAVERDGLTGLMVFNLVAEGYARG